MLTLALPDWLDTVTFCGLSPAQWCGAALIAASTYMVLDRVRRWGICKLLPPAGSATSAPATRAATDVDAAPASGASGAAPHGTALTDVAAGLLRLTRKPMMIAIAALSGLSAMAAAAAPGSEVDTLLAWLQRGWQTALLLQCALWASGAVRLLGERYLNRHRSGARHDDGINPVIVRVLTWFVRTVMWTLFLLSLLAQGGVNITAFVASLSIGAAAIGFAVQGILSDLFASLAIGLDKPFAIGDFVTFGEVSGTIEQVGMKTTRIRSLRGEEIICSNTDLLKQQIHNFQRMQRRRIAFRFGLAYTTPAAALRDVPAMIEQALAAIPNTLLDRVHFAALAERALEFEVVYYVTRPEYAAYMDCQQALNLAIVEDLAARGIAFAQPIREIRMQTAAAPCPPGSAAGDTTPFTTPTGLREPPLRAPPPSAAAT